MINADLTAEKRPASNMVRLVGKCNNQMLLAKMRDASRSVLYFSRNSLSCSPTRVLYAFQKAVSVSTTIAFGLSASMTLHL
jgi:hypothetical protein